MSPHTECLESAVGAGFGDACRERLELAMVSFHESPRELFASQLPLIERVITAICRRHRLSGADAEDFASTARLRLLENDFGVLRRFEGRCSLRTFLLTVVDRFYLDYRTAAWGRWRPSARARRLGSAAIALERLVWRDDLPFEEACKVLHTTPGVTEDAAELDTLLAKLPPRPKRRMVDDGQLASMPAIGPGADQEVLEGEVRRAIEALDRALARLTPRDRMLIQARYFGQRSVADLACRHRFKQRRLYPRFQKLLAKLKADLEAEGVRGLDVAAWSTGDFEPARSRLRPRESPSRPRVLQSPRRKSGERPRLLAMTG
jgi:RNA polymerase sigma factor for flagellar operon FliA